MIRSVPALLAVLLTLPACAGAQVVPPGASSSPPPGQRTIRVTGEGEVMVAPDVAVVNAGVEATGKDLARVGAEVSGRTRAVLAALRDLGVAERDVQTVRHDVSVERTWKDGVAGPITGYTVADELRITVRDPARLGAVLDRVVAAGSNTLRGLSFEREDPAPERRRALALAVGAARAKAEAIARAAGVELGEPIALAEATPPPPGPMFRAAAARSSEVPVSPGEVRIDATVEAIFAIR